MGGIGHGPWIATALLLGAVALTSAAMADPIPLPRPAPLPKEGAAPATAARVAAQPAEPGHPLVGHASPPAAGRERGSASGGCCLG